MREKYTTSFFLHDLVPSYGCDKVGYLFHAGDTHGRLPPQDDEGERKVHGTYIGLFYKIYYFSAVGDSTLGVPPRSE